MKILINGIIRDMTEEEEAEFVKEHENLPEIPEGAMLGAKAESFDILMGVDE